VPVCGIVLLLTEDNETPSLIANHRLREKGQGWAQKLMGPLVRVRFCRMSMGGGLQDMLGLLEHGAQMPGPNPSQRFKAV
jgi:hypothetical protein